PEGASPLGPIGAWSGSPLLSRLRLAPTAILSHRGHLCPGAPPRPGRQRGVINAALAPLAISPSALTAPGPSLSPSRSPSGGDSDGDGKGQASARTPVEAKRIPARQ